MPSRTEHAEPTAIDEAYLAIFYECSEDSLIRLKSSPTRDLVASFLQSVSLKAREFETLKAQKLQTDVELENAVRTSDTKNRAQKAAIARQSKELEELRIKLNEAESSRENYVTQLSHLQSNALDSTNESQTLQTRIKSLEHSNRDTLALIESHSTERDRVQKELENTHSKVVQLRKDNSKLEEQNRVLESQASSQKFKEQSLKQQLDLLKNNNERQAEELRTTSAEHSRLRKDRNARINALERERDDATSLVETLRQTEVSLLARLEELQRKTENAFARIAKLQTDKSTDEQAANNQIQSTKRLAELHAQSASTHKARLEELQGQIDAIRDDAAEEIARLQIDIEAERTDKAQMERTVADLELRLEEQQRNQRASLPGTPTRNGNQSSATVPGSAQKIARALTHTQLYANFVETKQQLEIEERRNASLQTTLDELLHEMESRAPELLELRQEQDRLAGEVMEFSRMLDDANESRDVAVRESQKWQEESIVNAREGDALRRQLRDVSVQVKILLVELQSKDQGLGEMTIQERLELERVARGDPDARAIENDTQQWISERLLIFRNIDELHGRNEELLRLVRELGDKMEGEEAQQKARQSAAYASENDELRKHIERYKSEMQTTAVQIDSYMKERDMFRRMLQYRGTIAPDADMQAMFGNSIMPATPQRNGIVPATPHSKDVEDLNKLIKEQQRFFDEYRAEHTIDRRSLKDQVNSLEQEKSTAQLKLAHAQSQMQLNVDRYELLHSNFMNLQNENVELQKRTQAQFENAAKQDMRTQTAAEELVQAESRIKTLENESNNTKAERELWKRLEDRLADDNKNLTDERNRLSKLNVDMSNLINEREHDANEARRRLQSRIEGLEAELAELKMKLDNEIETGKNAVLRREYEETQNRTRIDDLTKSLGYSREELAAAKTARDQLQSRVDDMKIELRAAEEKATALQPRPSAKTNGTTTGDDGLAPEQQLAIQLSDARRDLDFARSELEGAREQIEQYKSIAQTTEEELASFNQTSEQYRQEADTIMATRDAEIKQLEQRLEDLTSELIATNSELSDLRTKHDNASQDLATQRAALEAELARLQDDAERHGEEKSLYQEDLKAQAEIAQQAQQSYETELVKHAEAARGLQVTRQELNTLRVEVASIRADAVAARTSLESGQESWSEQKASLQREVTELNQRRTEAVAQNNVLHQQLATFSTELQALRQGRAGLQAGGADHDALSTTDSNLQEVITFLRREKDILEVQHELAVQESQRMRQQLTHANGQIDDLQSKLAEERTQHATQAMHEANASKLSQMLDELNLFRESSVTLRSEARQARERYEEKSKEVEGLLAELQPLQARLGELEADVEIKDGEIKLITTDRDHWRDRTQNIISKYDRVDPAELEELKGRIESLQTEKEHMEADQASLKEQLAASEQRITEVEIASNERLDRLKEQAKQRNREQVTKLNDVKSELNTAQAEQTRITAELAKAKEELSQAPTKTSTTAEQSGMSNDEVESLRSQLAEADAQANVRTVEVETLQTRVKDLEQQIEVLSAELVTARSPAKNVDEEQGEVVEGSAMAQTQQELSVAQQELADMKKEIARLLTERTANSVTEPPGTAEDGEEIDLPTELAKLRVDMQQQHDLAIKRMEEATEAKIAKMKSNLVRQLQEQKAQIKEETRAALVLEHSVEVQNVRAEYEQQIKSLQDAHLAELEHLKMDAEAAAVRYSSNTTIGSSVGEATAEIPEITEEYVNNLMKTNQRVRTVMQNSVRKTVAKETEKLSQALAVKDAEIAKLRETPAPDATALAETVTSAVAGQEQDSTQVSESVLHEALEKARLEKEAAVRQALDNAEKKSAVQLSQRNIAQAKVAFVAKAASETPARPVGEVWEEAKKAKPAPKPDAKPAETTSSTIPAEREVEPPQVDGTSSEAARLKARQERFGNVQGSKVATNSRVGQPSSSSGDSLTGHNPQAAAFIPAAEPTSINRASGSSIPTASTRGGLGGARVTSGSYAIQGAATRGGQASGIARGGGNNRNGLKRQHEGGGDGGDGKRARGGRSNA